MYKNYNPNPHGNRVSDCVIRAISKALNKTWGETYIELCLTGYLMGDLPSSNSVWGNYLKTQGFKKDIIAEDCPECYTIDDFCEEHPKGTYVVGTGSHAVAVIDGVLFDSWDSRDEMPVYFYKKEE